jgi:hypothetical protein
VVSLGFGAGGKRVRKKVSGQTRTEVKDKLKALHAERDGGVRTVQGYTVEAAVADWLAEGLPGRAVKTVEVYRDALRPVLAVAGGGHRRHRRHPPPTTASGPPSRAGPPKSA